MKERHNLKDQQFILEMAKGEALLVVSSPSSLPFPDGSDSKAHSV